MSQNRTLAGALRFVRGNNLIFALTDLLGNFARGLVLPYVSLYILALGGDTTQIGLVSSIGPLAGLLMFPIGGYVADRASRVKVVALGNLVSAALILMFIFAPSWEVLAIASLLQGFTVFLFPARSALIADSLPPGDRGRGFAAQNAISWGLSVFAPYIGGVVVEAQGPRAGLRGLFWAMLSLYALSALIQARFLKETTARSGNETRMALSDLRSVLREVYGGIPSMLRELPRSLKALAAVIVLSFVATAVATPFWVLYAMDHVGLSSSQWGLVLLAETILKSAMAVPAGMLVDRWGRAASLAAALLISLVSIPLFVFAPGLVAVLVIRLVLAIAFAIGIPSCSALMADLVPRDGRGRVMAALGQGGILIGMAGGVGGPGLGFVTILPLMIASLAGGYLYAWNPASPWFVAAIATGIAVLLIALYIRDPKQAEV
ncbi:MAG: MFS transporter [Anaerolineae bacterium]|nr:MFS transporter [Anaerolineae bacterium]